jgi:hypothetical protein
MIRKIRNSLIFILLAGIILLAGCSLIGAQTTVAPTTDEKAMRTEVAETIVAKITYESALTSVAGPTNTQVPTNTALLPATATLQPENTAAQAMPTMTATSTSAPISGPGLAPVKSPTFYPDRAELVGQEPADWTVFRPGEEFDLKWTIKNTGSRAWTTEYYYRYLSGPAGTSGSQFMVTNAAGVGDTVLLIVDMVAPSEPGNYTSTWQFINNDGVAFFTPYFSFTVVAP